MKPLPADLAERLLAWYRTNARILPWRKDHDPYRVWISEIMLQQTRVETVIPYYERFLSALPDIRSLAEVPEEKLLKLWEGLGYYSRARNLQKAAKKIMTEFDGIFPDDPEKLRSLPGIGEYTSGAILSIAFGKPFPAVDGNVLRVCARLAELPDDVSEPKVRKRISEELKTLYPVSSCGDFTQSLMELGATVCLPNGDPLCGKCPLFSVCCSGRNGSWSSYPVLPEKKARKIVPMTVLILHGTKKDSLLLRKRPASGLLASLWELPWFDGHLKIGDPFEKDGFVCTGLRKKKDAKHIFTHIEWRMCVYEGFCLEFPEDVIEGSLEDHPLPTAFRKLF